MTFRRLSRREQVLAGVAFVVVALGAIYTWGIGPVWERWTRLEAQIRVEEMRLLRDRRLLEQEETIRAEYAQDAQNLQADVTEEEVVGQLLQEVDRISSALGPQVRMRELKPQASVDRETYRVYSVELEAEGRLSELAQLVYELERSPAGLRVSRLQVGPTGEGEELEGRLVVRRIVVGT